MQNAPDALSPPLPEAPEDWALFLDLDGTLAEIAPRPEYVVISPDLVATLGRIYDRLAGAIAIVSGRPLDQIDTLLSPLALPAAGLHGLERRRAPGAVVERVDPPFWYADVAAALTAFTAENDGAWIEDKGITLALHYRGMPALEPAVGDLTDRIRQAHPQGLAVQTGKMIAEFRPQGDDKGDVVDFFMTRPPYTGRTPVFVGDDVTDERGFLAVRERGGHAVHVGGNRDTAAEWRLSGVDETRRWLFAVADAVAPESGTTDT